MNISEEVKKLNLPLGGYVIVGSGPLAARGIRSYKDIDILVTKNLYEKLIKNGWKIIEINGVNEKFEELKNGKFEITKRFWCGDYKPSTETLIKNAEVINGVPFMPLPELIKFKKALGREKDLKDIVLIENYLNKEVATEEFLDYICNKYGFLLHGSIHKIKNGKLTSKNNKIFATNKAVVAIARSLYSNAGVNLQYPYFINNENPFILKIHTQPNGKFIKKDVGFVYVLKSDGFKSDPKNSWQFIKENNEIDFIAVIETKSNDFKYPVEIFKDYDFKI